MKKLLRTLFAVLPWLTAVTFSLQAEEPASAPDKKEDMVVLEKFVVTSVNMPTANTLADRQQIELQTPASSVLNIIKYLPGVNLSQGDTFGGDDWSSRVTVRGFSENQLGFTVDGVPTGFTTYGGGTKPNRFLDVDNVFNVVLSQGAGDISSATTQALGGTLAYMTDDPRKQRGAEIKLTTGSFNTTRTFIRADTGKFGGNNAAYLSFSTEQNDNWVSSFVGGSPATNKRSHVDFKDVSNLGRAKLTLWASLDSVAPEINYQGISTHDFANNPRNDELTFNWTGNPDIDQNYAQTWTTWRNNSLVSAKLEVPLNDTMHLSVQPYWHHQQGKGGFLPPYQILRYNLAGNVSPYSNYLPAGKPGRVYYADANGANLLPVNPATGAVLGNGAASDITQYTWLSPTQQASAHRVSSFRYTRYQNNRFGDNTAFDVKLADNNKLVIGMWNELQDRLRFRTWHKVIDPKVGFAYNEQDYAETFHWRYKTTTNMFYVQDQYTTGNLTVTAGAKVYRIGIDDSESLIDAGGKPNYHGTINTNSSLLPSLGVQYKLNSDSEFFASYTRNFSAIPDTILEDAAGGADVSKAKPEKAVNIDFGYRYSDHNWALSVTGYDIKYTDKLVALSGVAATSFDFVGGAGYINIGGLDSYGAEAAAKYRIGSGLTAMGSFSYTHATYTDTVAYITKGKTVVDTPKVISSVGLLYKRDGVDAGLVAKYTDQRYSTYDNDNSAPGYTVVDFNAGYTKEFHGSGIKSVTVAFTVSNLFDKSYLSSVSVNDQNYVKSDPTGTTMLWLIGSPRTYTFTVGVGF